jgi:acyl-coenzyme A synthetase/AMP-(fatty) acid ligase/thioesterase domain-containing protein/acyl carrier protein
MGAGQLLSLDEIGSAPLAAYPQSHTTPDDLAYVLYTSGSTGKPKGVMRTHRGLLSNVMRGTNARQVCAGDRVALLFSYSFSAAVGNAFTALLNGATLLPFNLRELGVARLGDWLIERDITHFHTVPTVFRHLTDALTERHVFPRLRHIQLGGETMFAKDADRFKKHFGAPCVMTVGMGTSESGHIFEFGIDKNTEIPTDLLPVGYQVEGTETFLVDTNGEPVGVGQIGEIAVRGSFVSPGYWRRPDLTAKKFRPDPTGGNARIYLTGDLACRLSDGCVFHLGRNDSRVRIRSQSVEIPEVEAALLRVPGVREVAVSAEEKSAGDLRLVAFVTADASLTTAAMRQAVSERLPAYMVPSDFHVLDALPLLPNGKVDRQALSRTTPTRRQEKPLQAPRTPIEEALTKIWAEVLGIDRVGVDENFFELGGHSLLTMRLFAHIEKAFGERLPLDTLLQAPTVMQLAGILAQRELSEPVPSLVALQPKGSKPPFFWVHGENSNAFLARYLGPDQPVYGLLQQSRDGRPAAHTTVEDIAGYYLKGIRRVQPDGPYFLGGYCVGGILAFEIAQQLRKQGQEVGLLTMVDPPYGERGPRVKSGEGLDDRLSRHRRAVAQLGPAQRIAYVGAGFIRKTRSQLRQMGDAARKLAAKIYIVTGASYSIPLSWRVWYINAVHSRAKRQYTPQVYPGRVVVIHSLDSRIDPESAWGGLAAGGLEVQRVLGLHEAIVSQEAEIGNLARQLHGCLERAQSPALRTEVSAVSHSG